MGIGANVTFMGCVPADDLPALYAGGAVLGYPSFVESFALRPLELMACGTPALVSREPAFSEILGDAALQVDPNNPRDMACKTAEAVTGSELWARLIENGQRRAAEFTWAKCATQTVSAFEETSGQGQRNSVAPANDGVRAHIGGSDALRRVRVTGRHQPREGGAPRSGPDATSMPRHL